MPSYGHLTPHFSGWSLSHMHPYGRLTRMGAVGFLHQQVSAWFVSPGFFCTNPTSTQSSQQSAWIQQGSELFPAVFAFHMLCLIPLCFHYVWCFGSAWLQLLDLVPEHSVPTYFGCELKRTHSERLSLGKWLRHFPFCYYGTSFCAQFSPGSRLFSLFSLFECLLLPQQITWRKTALSTVSPVPVMMDKTTVMSHWHVNCYQGRNNPAVNAGDGHLKPGNVWWCSCNYGVLFRKNTSPPMQRNICG